MYALLVAAAVGMCPHASVLTDTADFIEVNHYLDEKGRPVFVQVIFWEWYADEGMFHVIDWRFWKSPFQTPLRDWAGGGYVTTWRDGHQLRRVRARGFRETWTPYDPEVLDRRHLPPSARRRLSR